MGTGMEMQVMMALFIGGVPVQGGTGTRIFKLLFGAPLIVLLENGLVLSGTSGPMTQLVKGPGPAGHRLPVCALEQSGAAA